TERVDPVAVDLLPAAHRTVPLPLRDPARTLDARAPGERLESGQRRELTESGLASVATGERSARPDAGRVEAERAKHAVDVIDRAERVRARVRVERRYEP